MHLAFFVKTACQFTLQLLKVVPIIQIMTCFLQNDRFCLSENNCFLSSFFNQETIALVTLKMYLNAVIFAFI